MSECPRIEVVHWGFDNVTFTRTTPPSPEVWGGTGILREVHCYGNSLNNSSAGQPAAHSVLFSLRDKGRPLFPDSMRGEFSWLGGGAQLGITDGLMFTYSRPVGVGGVGAADGAGADLSRIMGLSSRIEDMLEVAEAQTLIDVGADVGAAGFLRFLIEVVR